ncbi:MAG TPA: glycosyltransferase [Bacillota bacterium]|nr:glycosyltransferase [Bacillota bacterium]
MLDVAYPLAPVGPDAVGGAEQVLTRLDAALTRTGHRSLVAMEALACGTPVIAFPFGALRDIVEHGKTGFQVHDDQDMAEAIAASSSLDSELCRQRAQERFTLERMIVKYFEVYHLLADSRLGIQQPKETNGWTAGINVSYSSGGDDHKRSLGESER